MTELRGQSAIEYLMTYGWMLLVVAVVGGALFAVVGDQSLESSSGFDSDLLLEQFGMTGFTMDMVFSNAGTEDAQIQEIKVSNGDTEFTFPGYGEQNSGSEFTTSIPLFDRQGGTEAVDVELIYDYGDFTNIGSKGELTGSWTLDEDVVGYWSLADKAGDSATDSSPNNYDSVQINGTVDQQASGLNGPAYDFDHTDSYSTVYLGEGDDLASVAGSDELTIGATVYPDEDPTTVGHDIRVIDRSYGSQSSDHDYMISLEGDTGEWRVRLNTETPDNNWFPGGSSDVDLNSWNTVVLTYDGEEAVFYANGEQLATNSNYDGSLITDSGETYEVNIGNGHDDGDPWAGKIQDVFVTERVLDEEEIQAYMNGNNYAVE